MILKNIYFKHYLQRVSLSFHPQKTLDPFYLRFLQIFISLESSFPSTSYPLNSLSSTRVHSESRTKDSTSTIASLRSPLLDQSQICCQIERDIFLYLPFFAGPLLRHPCAESSHGTRTRMRVLPPISRSGRIGVQIHPVPEVIGQGSHEHAFSMHSREGYSTRADLVRKQRGVTGSR